MKHVFIVVGVKIKLYIMEFVLRANAPPLSHSSVMVALFPLTRNKIRL